MFECGRHGSTVCRCVPSAREPGRRTVGTQGHKRRTRCASTHEPCTHSEIHTNHFTHDLIGHKNKNFNIIHIFFKIDELVIYSF